MMTALPLADACEVVRLRGEVCALPDDHCRWSLFPTYRGPNDG